MSPSRYIKALTGSLSSVRYYLSVLGQPLTYSVIFFVISCLLLGVGGAISFNIKEKPIWEDQTSSALTEFQNRYPPDLTVVWDTQKLAWQPAETLHLPYPNSIPSETWQTTPTLAFFLPTEVSPENLVTNLPAESLFVVTPTRLLINEGRGNWNQVELQSLPGFENQFTVNSGNLPTYLMNWQNQLDQVFKLLSVAVYIFGPLGYLLSRIWASLIDSLLFYILFHLYGIRLSWKKVWQLSLHIIIAASLLTFVAEFIYPQLELPLMTISTWVIFTYIILTLKSHVPHPPAE